MPPPQNERYRYIDQAYSMGQAFADTPPDYAVNYQDTQPWVWRSGNGAYRIMEQLPQGERYYYYYPGQNEPFLVRDPYYSYAYDRGALVGVYGRNGAELQGALAVQRAAEASRYFYHSQQLYRAALFQQRQPAYASAWAARRDQLRAENLAWQQQQARNAEWQAWHNQHAADEARQWRQERDQRLAYAAAIGLVGPTATSSAGRSQPDAAQVAQRQAAYFSHWNAAKSRVPATQTVALRTNAGAPKGTSSAPAGGPNSAGAPIESGAKVKEAEAAAAQAQVLRAKAAQAAHAQQMAAQAAAAQAKVAEAKSAQAKQAEQLAAKAKQREAEAAQTKTAQAAHSQELAADAKQREAAAAQTKSAEAAHTQELAAKAKQREAEVARTKAAQAAHTEELAAQRKERETALAQAKAAQAAHAQEVAAKANKREAEAAQAKASQTVRAQKLEAKARQPNHDNRKEKNKGKSPPRQDSDNRNQER